MTLGLKALHPLRRGQQRKTWEKEGRGEEVKRALRKMRWFRMKTALVLVGQRFGDFMGSLMLSVLYCTLFLPFGLIAALTPRRTGWTSSARVNGRSVVELRLQA